MNAMQRMRSSDKLTTKLRNNRFESLTSVAVGTRGRPLSEQTQVLIPEKIIAINFFGKVDQLGHLSDDYRCIANIRSFRRQASQRPQTPRAFILSTEKGNLSVR